MSLGRKSLDLTGRRFGRWLVVKNTGHIQRSGYKELKWLCLCDCGIERELGSRILLHKTQNSRSCGCARAEKQRDNPSRLKHGLNNHRLYPTWKTMRQRCNNPNSQKYHRYGARGIKVCERWNDFEKFLEDMGDSWSPGLTIDRIDNDGDYTPENCRWATFKEQTSNRSNGNRKLVIVNVDDYIAPELESWADIPAINNILSKFDDVQFETMHGKNAAVFSIANIRNAA